MDQVDHLGIPNADNIPRLENLHYQSLDSDLIIRGDLIWEKK
jgi:hypothetical protein